MSNIIIGGTIAIDNVSTPNAEAKNLLGGSAAYASLAASYYTKPAHLVGVVGHDYPEEHLEMLESHGVDLSGVERSDSESFTWTGEYHENMNDRTTHRVGLNVLESWKVQVPDEIADSRIVVPANMSPDNQIEMLDQCTAAEKFVVADTMDLWIEIANERLHEVLQRIDLLVINESEARDFAGTSNLILAGEILLEKGPRYVVIKLGEFGAILFGPDNAIFKFHAWPLREIVDPTGAGDTFLGAMAGYLADLGGVDFSFAQIRDAILRGSILASFTCEDFSTRRLETVTEQEIQQRLDGLKAMSQWD
ncbi:carbohydrate kinase [Verrucomicrobiaceae bacterium 5K15]|uniref:Carbohydrate kinase n=1 Tax=Oceaniferula flava TaxID=2800421 RepID=A0AAE2SDG2_9BACT|nr:PfkB family carbohydrate kinase [Oceaniferula flavus]MBK1854301.1 carbohydrate kinase [Oceaniferula flavus]MBM1135607.1 carbohydrate kinase [Oceaniferula flavus]